MEPLPEPLIGPSPPCMTYMMCVDGATVTPLTSSLSWGMGIVLTSLNSWSMSYTEVVPSCRTYSRWETPVAAATTALWVEVADADGPAALLAITDTRTVLP